MLLDLEAHREVKTEIDSDNSSHGEVSQVATVLQADLLGLDLPTYKASSSEVCRHCGACLWPTHLVAPAALDSTCLWLQVSPSIQSVAAEPKRHRSPSGTLIKFTCARVQHALMLL